MTTDRDKCGFGSLLPMSCRGRAEAFARRLHSRLRTLGSQDGNGAADESSWLAANENPIAVSQPRHSSETDLYFDLTTLESPGSPDEDLEVSELQKLINRDNLLNHSHSEDCHCSVPKEKTISLRNGVNATSNDSDSSDGPFYDTVPEILSNNVTNIVNGIDHSDLSEENEAESTTPEDKSQENSNRTEEIYATTSECTLPLGSSSASEEDSTVSLNRDDDTPSLDVNGSLTELPICDETASNIKQEDNPESNSDNETYRSGLRIERSLTVECPPVVRVLVTAQKKSIELEDAELVDNRNREDDDDDDIVQRIPRVRRCSSLKTGKTPPGTPGRKKIVRFADVLGLDLADVRTFLDEIPKIPTSAYEDLKDVDLVSSESDQSLDSSLKFHGITVDKILVPLFQQPGGQSNFLDRVRDKFVCLENALVEDPIALAIAGMVRVRNLDFNKSVHIRYSLDSWQTFADIQGVYVENSCDGFSDKFTFLMYAHTLTVGQRLEFAVRFQCKGCQYWDNNNGGNYCFQCLPATNHTQYNTPITGVDENWGASFYYQEDSDENVDDVNATRTAVQEFITQHLGTKLEPPPKKTPDMLTVFVILIFSFLFMYLQKATYFAK